MLRFFGFAVLAATLGCGGKTIYVTDDASADSVTSHPDAFEPDAFVHDTLLDTPVEAIVDPPPPTDPRTTGKACMTDDECDVTGAGISHCTSDLFVVGPLNPTPVCIEVDGSSDVCTPTVGTDVHLCDGDMGICTKLGDTVSSCWPYCAIKPDGTWAAKCLGKNACSLLTTDAFGVAYGMCEGGCRTDSDCPTGSRCDPNQRFCATACTADIDCTKRWSGAPANWKCDAAHGLCAFAYTKKIGDSCTATANECVCVAGTSGSGTCSRVCRPGDACPTGFTCDALLPSTIASKTQPPELEGKCLRNCKTDADCSSVEVCGLSAGLTQKTCRPKT